MWIRFPQFWWEIDESFQIKELIYWSGFYLFRQLEGLTQFSVFLISVQKEGGTQLKLIIDYPNDIHALFKPMRWVWATVIYHFPSLSQDSILLDSAPVFVSDTLSLAIPVCWTIGQGFGWDRQTDSNTTASILLNCISLKRLSGNINWFIGHNKCIARGCCGLRNITPSFIHISLQLPGDDATGRERSTRSSNTIKWKKK